MENIRQAVQRAHATASEEGRSVNASVRRDQYEVGRGRGAAGHPGKECQLNASFLETKRIISHDVTDTRSRAFDMLRTQVLRTMDLKGWKVIGITSPTPACGKTVTSINLALSIARQPERDVLLVDMDMQRPQVAACLGIEGGDGVYGILDGRSTLLDEVVGVRIGIQRMSILPTRRVSSGSSEYLSSSALSQLMQNIRSDYSSSTVVVDMSPLLSSDDAMTIIPHLDCLLLIAAAGSSTLADITEVNKHLQSIDVVRVVLTKTTENLSPYYYY